ncbi:MAG: thymidine phosphorylase, partial [Clostridia bacterium]|nr:thymidine phosphorylase [Clostridia bacterium]
MRAVEIIDKNKVGGRLTKEELTFIANGAADGSIPDYQLSAWLMAVWFRGMDAQETLDLTLAMAHSGTVNDLSAINGIKVDKHSTGGVGDKTTLIVAPVAAACGLKVAKMSGRGLGFTGGTVDKLESIRGLSTSVEPQRFADQVNGIGLCVAGQSGRLAPADKALYALRDVTATVDCLPLIASSIMSKKLAGGADVIVLDVKCGRGAFMKTPEDARRLARAMVDIGNGAGRKTVALITDMDVPLGRCVGNLLEVEEAVGVLRGEGHPALTALCRALCEQMLVCSGLNAQQAAEKVTWALESGAAFEKLCEMVTAQGGDADWLRHPDRMPRAVCGHTVKAPCDGYLTALDSLAVGEAAMLLGAGRAQKDDAIDPTAGIVLHAERGDAVCKGQPIATLYAA